MQIMPRRSKQVADILHRSAVVVLLAITGITGCRLGYEWYKYYTVVKPQRLQNIENKRLEEQMLVHHEDAKTLENIATIMSVVPIDNSVQRVFKDDDKLMTLGKLNHVAIATPSLEKAVCLYRDVFGAKVSEPVQLPEHGVTTVFVDLGNTKLELLHPLGGHSPIEKFLEKNKDGGIHHICIEVDDISAAMAHARHMNLRCLSEEPKIGAHGKPVVFLHPKDCAGVLVELEQI